ncbi:heavy-metal-associated domain-containing protein [Streptomyces sp. NBC_01808]|uniref:heavy-metal-associated domain-containing protein n=1 Tax=Streptomyces sp. NBC_01808 TaxID=2975947 RepID=UPI002DD8C5B1|nr:heavy-metal-associated domain-containing protein [Streptomyces sp. NBC_01808]WSA41681.1 heavy-metal-associated domain-containing protein [Streptomyces sp. NBC_01808]
MSEGNSCCSTDGSCGGGSTTEAAPQTGTVFTVSGMTCAHCEASVTKEISALPGVTSVKADAATGTVSVRAGTALDDAQVRGAVEEAGYELVGRA